MAALSVSDVFVVLSSGAGVWVVSSSGMEGFVEVSSVTGDEGVASGASDAAFAFTE